MKNLKIHRGRKNNIMCPPRMYPPPNFNHYQYLSTVTIFVSFYTLFLSSEIFYGKQLPTGCVVSYREELSKCQRINRSLAGQPVQLGGVRGVTRTEVVSRKEVLTQEGGWY